MVHACGPIRRAGPWAVTALGPALIERTRHLRVALPSSLYEGWADATLSEDAQRLTVNASRARGLVFARG